MTNASELVRSLLPVVDQQDRLGNETSQRQWSDLTAVARLQADRLDQGYLRYWASELGVADLAERLLREVAT